MPINLFEDCSFGSLAANFNNLNLEKFNCDNSDLNEFFQADAINYSKNLLGNTYVFSLDTDKNTVVCMFTVSNDSIKANDLPNNRKKKISKQIPYVKQRKSYPAVLIGRLGVDINFAGSGVGTQLMDFIKAWFIDPLNKTGCRFLIVDAYNTKKSINYYIKNEFEFLFSTEQQEKKYIGLKDNEELNTRMMFFDLFSLKAEIGFETHI